MPKNNPVLNIEVTDHGDARLDFNRVSVSCEHDGARFHYWADITLEPAKNEEGVTTIFKNPPLARNSRDPGYYQTRRLRSDAGQGKLVFDAMVATAPGLLIAAVAARKAQDDAEASRRKADRITRRAMEQGPRLVGALRSVIEDYRLLVREYLDGSGEAGPALARIDNACALLREIDSQEG